MVMMYHVGRVALIIAFGISLTYLLDLTYDTGKFFILGASVFYLGSTLAIYACIVIVRSIVLFAFLYRRFYNQ